MLNSHAENFTKCYVPYYTMRHKHKPKFPLNFKSGTTVPNVKLMQGTFSVYRHNVCMYSLT